MSYDVNERGKRKLPRLGPAARRTANQADKLRRRIKIARRRSDVAEIERLEKSLDRVLSGTAGKIEGGDDEV